MYITKPLTPNLKHFPTVAAALAEDRQWVYLHNIDFHQERVRDEFAEHGLRRAGAGDDWQAQKCLHRPA